MTVQSAPSSSEAQNGFPNLNTYRAQQSQGFVSIPHESCTSFFKGKREGTCLTKIPHLEREWKFLCSDCLQSTCSYVAAEESVTLFCFHKGHLS